MQHIELDSRSDSLQNMGADLRYKLIDFIAGKIYVAKLLQTTIKQIKLIKRVKRQGFPIRYDIVIGL